ncbi:membrane dipeptidase [Salinisphaera sp. USBA-960]|uniref:dipeptidase n=1 Tax=Salinisphaera orenii TaxID=856731 RepID=UPI000DBE6055|nr:membrane dipeptidase [Salifodinibacter halophilus]NNC26902.1 membrane dipeptidase [Salifodinibacter halophilus]
MSAKEIHTNAAVFDGLIIANWSRPVFEAMHAGGLTAANCTCSVWEGFEATMANIATWQQLFADNADLIRPVHCLADIERAMAEGRVGIVLGFQNLSAIEDRIERLSLFKQLGVGVMQMAYNTQNFVGSGCYESRDGGLSDFGHDVVAEMNRLGILCDLSHVGDKTSTDVIHTSRQPVAYSHCLPAGLKKHPRNKTDEQLRFIVDYGGFVGVTLFPPFLKHGPDSTVDDYIEAIDYVIDICGEQNVGIGTDFTEGQPPEFFDWITRDKGNGRKLTEFGAIRNPEGLRTIADFPNLSAAMVRAGWSESRIERVLGGNWLRVLGEVWGDSPQSHEPTFASTTAETITG